MFYSDFSSENPRALTETKPVFIFRVIFKLLKEAAFTSKGKI